MSETEEQLPSESIEIQPNTTAKDIVGDQGAKPLDDADIAIVVGDESGVPSDLSLTDRIEHAEDNFEAQLAARGQQFIGKVVEIKPLEIDTNYLVIRTDKNETHSISLLDAWDRAYALLEMAENFSRELEGEEEFVESAFQYSIMLYRACTSALKLKGVEVPRVKINQFEQRLRAVEKGWRKHCGSQSPKTKRK